MKNDKSFMNLFVKFSMVMVVPVVIVSIIVVLICFARIEVNTKNLNVKMLEQANTIIDAEIGQVAAAGYKIPELEPVSEFLSVKYYNSDELNVLLWRCKKSMRLYTLDGNIMDSVAVYGLKNDIIITNSTTYSAQEYYDEFMKGVNFSEDDFEGMLKKSSTRLFFIPTDSQILYCSVIRNTDNNAVGTFIAALNKSWIITLLKDAGINDKIGFAMTDPENILLRSDNFNEKLFAKTDGLGEFRSGHKYALVYRSQLVRNLDYAYSINERDFVGSTRIMLLLLLLAVLLSIGVSSIFGRRNMKRANSILSEIYDENRLLSSKLDEQIKNIKSQVLQNVLLGGVNDFEKNNISLERGLMRILLVDSDYIGSLRNGIDETVDRYFKGSGVECQAVYGMEHTNTYILIYSDQQLLKRLLEGLKNKFSEEYGINADLGIGAETSEAKKLSESYETAGSALRYAALMSAENARIVYYDDIRKQESTKIYYPREKGSRLATDMKLGLSEETAAHFEDLYDKNFRQRQLSSGALRQLLVSIIATMYEVIEQIYPDNVEKSDEFGRVCRNIMRSENAEDAFETLKRICISLCERAAKCSRSSSLKEKITDYMNENFTNPDLSLDMMSTDLGISYYYISRLFTEYMGMSFLSYLTSMRLEYSCGLLDTTSLTVEQISEKSGFLNSNSFIRVFKKYYNITPGKYRKK